MCAQRQAAPSPQRPDAAPNAADSGKPAKARYVSSLDGLRALCALGVVFYHMGLTWCQGGLLGVTVLFVLSGYLAMGGLLAEFGRTGTISCSRYYLKRAKRLLPTAVVYVVVCAAACTLFSHQLLTKMRGDIAPALLMVLNWYKILSKQSYFAAAGAPSPLTHFWSLAIEFQFYLILPPILCLVLKHKVPKKKLAAGLAVAAILSAVAMAALYVPEADPSRAYYGTDTRAQSLLIGCLLALVWPFGEMGQKKASELDARRRLFSELAAGLGTIALVAMMGLTEGYSSFSYYGGTFACSIIAALAIAGLVPEGTVASKILSWEPLAWIGKRSFAIYIWHYLVVQLFASHNAAIGLAWWQVVLELLATLILSELSYRIIEEPLRRHSFRAVFRHDFLKRRRRGQKGQEERSPESGAKVPAFLAPAVRAAKRSPLNLPRTIATAAVCAIAVLGIIFVPAETAVGTGESQQMSAATLKKPLVDGVYDVVFIGDSVSLGAASELNAAFPHGLVDAAVSRQASAALDVYNGYAAEGVVGQTVIFSIGTNGYLTEDVLQSIYDAVGPDRQLWFVNDRTPRDWCQANNDLLASFADKYSNVGVIDWYGASADHGEWFWDDQTHLREDYADQFADLVVSTIGYEVPTDENTTYSVVFLGDAVSMGAADELSEAWPQGMVDCAAGRATAALGDAWESYVAAGTAGKRLVIVPPADVPLDSGLLDDLLDRIGSDVEVWLVTSRSSASFVEANNQLLADEASSRSNVHLIDWYAASAGHSEYFSEDGTSLSEEGQKAYAALVVDAVGDVSSASADAASDGTSDASASDAGTADAAAASGASTDSAAA